MSDVQTTAEARKAIQSRMSQVREDLSQDADRFASNVKEATDWRHQVRSHPVAAAGLAALAGYWLVPSRPRIERPDPETLAELARQRQLVVTEKPIARKQSGLLAAGLSLASSFALRAATAYIGQQAGRVFGEAQADEAATGGQL